MKVIVGKMPGGRAQQIEVEAGCTVLEAVRAAGYEQDLNSGYEARLNNSPTELNTVVTPNSIISLTQKITGNSDVEAIKLVSVFCFDGCKAPSAASRLILSGVPVYLSEFLKYDDVKSDIVYAMNSGEDGLLMVAVLQNGVLTSPQTIFVDNYDIRAYICDDVQVHKDDAVCVFEPSAIGALYSKDRDHAMELLNEAIREKTEAEIEDENTENGSCLGECDGCPCEDEKEPTNITIADLAKLCKQTGIHMTIGIPN